MPQESMHTCDTYHCGRSCVVTHFNWIPKYEWYMARRVVKNRHENNTLYDEI